MSRLWAYLVHRLPWQAQAHRSYVDAQVAKRLLQDHVQVPFVVTLSHGGHFEDSAFLAGAQFGSVATQVAVLGYLPHAHCVAELAPQLDLLAMSCNLRVSMFVSDDPNVICVEMFPPVTADIKAPARA